jgi:peptidoglycan/xylan/chitin deacetylase (PgdA/CDA1 family)
MLFSRDGGSEMFSLLGSIIFCATTTILSFMLIVFLIYWNLMKFAKLIFSGYDIIFENKENSVILTIDDVPYGKSFEKILDLLDKYPECKVSFFFISSFQTEPNTDLLLRAIKSGHHLANHGKVDKMHAKCTRVEFANEIETCQEALEKLYQDAGIPMPKTKYFRPGSGLVNQVIQDYCREHNYKIVLGSNYCSDPQVRIPSLNEFYVWRHLRPNDILILHDRSWTLPLLENLFSKGLKTTSLLQLELKPKSS